jgi:DNA-binding transcriptional LysR family regulator
MAALDSYLRANLKPRQLHLLVALDDYRNVGKVAVSICVTQPAVSKSLAELEKGLGVKLFERTVRGVHPTAYGECLIRHARTVLAELSRARDELKNLTAGASGTLCVGVLSTAAIVLMPQALAAFKRRSPGTTVLVRESTLESLLPDLWSGKLDMIVGRLPDPRSVHGLEEKVLSEEAVTLVAGAHHPLAHRKRLRWSDLSGYPWVLPPVGTLLREPLERAFERHATPMPANCVETLSYNVILDYLELTDAIAALAYHPSKHYQRLGALSVLALELPNLVRPVGVMWSRQRALTPSAKLMVECLERVAVPSMHSEAGQSRIAAVR